VTVRFPELGFYTLPGKVTDPARILTESRDGERLGFGSVWISERHDVKEAATLCGAAGAVTEHMAVATGVTNHHTRHPMILASFGGTMSALTGGRFCLGFGRGFDILWKTWGLPVGKLDAIGDTIGLLRRLWAGETIVGHQGPSGTFPYLKTAVQPEIPPTIGMAALGPRTQEWAGAHADVVLLHSHWTDRAVSEAVARVRRGAEAAGRDPDAVQVWSCVVTACDLPDERVRALVAGRMTTYMQIPGYGELIVDANGWDRAVLDRVRAHPLFAGLKGSADAAFTLEQLAEIADVYPDEWLIDANAVGPAAQCARRLNDQFAAGASGVVLHASAPAEMVSLLDAYAAVRDPRLDARSPVPGR
jgi:5,10-methylenetetrahydromethanopterin reductase